MTELIFRAECIERPEQDTFVVFCLRCKKDMGSMTGKALRWAIMATSERGGVLCPNCRSESCYNCGVGLFAVKGCEARIFCDICGPEYRGIEGMGKARRERERGTVYRVPQNSKNNPSDTRIKTALNKLKKVENHESQKE